MGVLQRCDMDTLHTGAAKQVESICDTVQFVVHNPFDAGLDNQFGTLHTRRRGDVERRTVGGVIATGHLCDGICLSMKHIRLGKPRLILTDILKSRRGSVESVGDNHGVLDNDGTYLPSETVGILRPNRSHPQIATVEHFLLVGLFHFVEIACKFTHFP